MASERIPVDDTVNDCFRGAPVKCFDVSSAPIVSITPEKGKALLRSEGYPTPPQGFVVDKPTALLYRWQA